MTISVIVCAYNEARYLPACLHSLLAQTRPPDEIVVVNNASSDDTGAVARAIPGIRVIDEPVKGLVIARETARRETSGDVLAYIDADCRVPIQWLERIERRFSRHPALVAVTGAMMIGLGFPPFQTAVMCLIANSAPVAWGGMGNPVRTLVAVTGPYRFYDWDLIGRALIRGYDLVVAPPTHLCVHYLLAAGAILYGGNFAVWRQALERIGGFDRSIEFHGEDTNLGRRLTPLGSIEIARECWVWTSARRYRAMGKRRVFGLYVRNFWSEILRHKPADGSHVDVRV